MQGGWDRVARLPIALVSRPIIPVSVLAMVHVLSITSASVKVDTEDTSARELPDHFENLPPAHKLLRFARKQRDNKIYCLVG